MAMRCNAHLPPSSADGHTGGAILHGLVCGSRMVEGTDLRYVVAVARAGTFTAAAEALGVNQSTVTRRVAALQEALGARLIERRGAEHVLTPVGERLRPMLA